MVVATPVTIRYNKSVATPSKCETAQATGCVNLSQFDIVFVAPLLVGVIVVIIDHLLDDHK